MISTDTMVGELGLKLMDNGWRGLVLWTIVGEARAYE